MGNLEQKLVAKYPILGSSQSPEEISATIKGVALALLPFLSLVLSSFGVNQEWVAELVNALVGFSGAVLVVYGVVRKLKR